MVPLLRTFLQVLKGRALPGSVLVPQLLESRLLRLGFPPMMTVDDILAHKLNSVYVMVHIIVYLYARTVYTLSYRLFSLSCIP